ncbi:UNVERIFIED_ORG: hypothetical protein ABIB19_000190 [Arthrobacter sp. UYEF10]
MEISHGYPVLVRLGEGRVDFLQGRTNIARIVDEVPQRLLNQQIFL